MLSAKSNVDLIYIEGPGDIVEALTRWYKREDMISETSLTFSGQVFDFCKENNLKTLAISAFTEKKCVNFENFSAYSQPKLMLNGAIGYHLSQVLHGLRIVATVIRYRPKYLHITNGTTHWFMLAPLKLFGIKIFPQLHNTFWAKGYPPTGKIQRILLKLDAWFLKNIASAAICCSPEIVSQIQKITNNQSCPTYVFRAQFYAHSFDHAAPKQPHEQQPFVVVFAGRVERYKGVFDILEMAEKLRDENVVFHICGGGSALKELKNKAELCNLTQYVFIHGRLNRPELHEKYLLGHVVIVPTRSDFAEGFAMVAAEAILLNRPIITSKIVPALDILSTASLEAESNNVDSYVNAIRQLASDKILYERLSAACRPLHAQFMDRKQGLTRLLQNTLP